MNPGTNDSNAAIVFDEVSVRMGRVSILERVSASVPRGGCTAIVGPNGAGKTTLLLCLLGECPHQGTISVRAMSRGKARIGYVPQRLSFDRALPMTVEEFMVLGVQAKPLWFGVRRDLKNTVRARLESVRAGHLCRRNLGALSGGEMQRVLLALALFQEPEILVLDEPAAGVDIHGEHVFCELLDELRRKQGFTQLMVSHDLASVTHHAGHAICLNHRVAAEGPPREVLTGETLTALFGMHMGLVASRSMPDGQTVCTAPCCRRNGIQIMDKKDDHASSDTSL
ncbi:metal ABC transporter ATP-binding protein [Desulfatiferula olefinivorans]